MLALRKHGNASAMPNEASAEFSLAELSPKKPFRRVCSVKGFDDKAG